MANEAKRNEIERNEAKGNGAKGNGAKGNEAKRTAVRGDAHGRLPRYLQVASILRRRIRDGFWSVGDKIATREQLEHVNSAWRGSRCANRSSCCKAKAC